MFKVIGIVNLKPKERLFGLILIIAIINYIILTSIAMKFYPGGYSFTEHTYSYLGKIKVDDEDNTIARILFILSSSILAIAIIPFWLSIRILFKQNNKTIKSGI